jgi:ATP-dependent DNA ligase
MSSTSFPTLFGESSQGKRKVWSIRVDVRDVDGVTAGVIVSQHGYENGKMVVAERVVTVGKNLGKKNETTPVQQAISEAQSSWNKKKDAGYAPSVPTGAEGAVSAVSASMNVGCAASSSASDTDVASAHSAPVLTGAAKAPLPMLAQDFNKRGKSIVFPCFAQKKLDGVRCVAMPNALFSRNGKKFPHLEHIRDEIAALNGSLVLDGELYSDELTFQEIVGLVKKETLRGADAEKMAKIHLCVYDMIVEGVANKDRNARLTALFAANSSKALRMLPTEICEKREDIKALHAKYVAEGYEGLMLRNMAANYRVGVRSTDLQKYKEFEDSEYTVTGFKEGDGAEKGCVIWICKTDKNQEFAVRPRGTHEERAEIMKNAQSYVGKKLTVRYQELTTDGIPRFPVGISFRDYE